MEQDKQDDDDEEGKDEQPFFFFDQAKEFITPKGTITNDGTKQSASE